MDIMDMPNTNKYSFEGWDNSSSSHLSALILSLNMFLFPLYIYCCECFLVWYVDATPRRAYTKCPEWPNCTMWHPQLKSAVFCGALNVFYLKEANQNWFFETNIHWSIYFQHKHAHLNVYSKKCFYKPTVCCYRANPVWMDPFCRNLELAVQADHEDDLPENLSDIADLWNSPARTHVSNNLIGVIPQSIQFNNMMDCPPLYPSDRVHLVESLKRNLRMTGT